MKHILILFTLLFSFAGAHAQSTEQTPDQQQAHNMAMRMKKNLSLTDPQTTQVEAVCLARIQEIHAIQNDASKSDVQKKADIEAVKTAKDNELATILTPDQMSQYKHLKQAKQDRATQANASGN